MVQELLADIVTTTWVMALATVVAVAEANAAAQAPRTVETFMIIELDKGVYE